MDREEESEDAHQKRDAYKMKNLKSQESQDTLTVELCNSSIIKGKPRVRKSATNGNVGNETWCIK